MKTENTAQTKTTREMKLGDVFLAKDGDPWVFVGEFSHDGSPVSCWGFSLSTDRLDWMDPDMSFTIIDAKLVY